MAKNSKNIPSQNPEIQPTTQPTPSSEPAQGLSLGKLWAIAALLALISFGLYQNAFKNDFVDWDDYAYVIENELVRNEKLPNAKVWDRPISLNYHPLTIQTMRWNSNKCPTCPEGISAAPFIRWNVIIHCLNVLLVFWFVLRLGKNSWWVAAFTALWFGIHPLHVESVAWVSERKDVLYVFFVLLGLLSYQQFLKTGEKGWEWWLGALLSLVLGCLAKAMAVVSPLLMMLVLFWRQPEGQGFFTREGIFSPKRLLYFAPLLAVSAFFGLMAVKIQSGQNFLGLLDVPKNTAVAINEFSTFKIIERLHFAAYGYSSYIAELFLPNNLCTFYPYPNRVEYDNSQLFYHARLLFMLGTIAVIFWGLFKSHNRQLKTLAFGFGFYLLAVALVLQFLSVGVVIKADRYSYLPYVGLIFMILTLLYQYLEDKPQAQKLAIGILGLVSAFFGYKTVQQIATWRNSETLWTQVINSQAGKNLEQPYSIRGHAYGKMADKAAKNNQPEQVKLYLDKAFADFQACVQFDTKRGEVFEGLGNIYGMRGDYPKALENYNKAASLDGKKASIYFNRGITHSILQLWDKAVADYNQAEELGNEQMNDLRRNRALAAINAGQYALAGKDLDILCKEQPNDYAHFANRGVCKTQLGDKAAAVADFQRALQLKPNDDFCLKQLNALQ